MPKQKDLKRLVRGRMQKTGESYTAARRQLLDKQTKQPSTNGPSTAEFAKLAGMSDEAVKAKTGRDWAQWTRLLDREGAASMAHREIVACLRKEGVLNWWTQMIAVGYERIRGLREIRQQRDGSYEAGKSKTIAVPAAKAYHAFTHAPTRERWLPAGVKIRTSVRDRSVRMTWVDGSSVEAYFVRKSAAKTQVAVQHRKLPDRAAIEKAKTYWSERLAALTELLATQ
jgi:hypothetical protein